MKAAFVYAAVLLLCGAVRMPAFIAAIDVLAAAAWCDGPRVPSGRVDHKGGIAPCR